MVVDTEGCDLEEQLGECLDRVRVPQRRLDDAAEPLEQRRLLAVEQGDDELEGDT